MKFKQIKETCLYFRDLEKARSFYHDLLELPIVSEVKEKHIFFRAGNSVLLCFNPDDSRTKVSPPGHFADGQYHFALEVSSDQYIVCKKEIERKGIAIIDTVKWEDGFESFYFNDPGGNVVEIVPAGMWG